MGRLHYVEGVTPGSPGPFTNITGGAYWYGTEFINDNAYAFAFSNGNQTINNQANSFYAWVVRDGDVEPVPEPGTSLLLATALIGLAGRGAVGRRRNPARS
jgi:hypothetical protein